MADSRTLVQNQPVTGGHPHAHSVEGFVERHGLTLLRAARRYSGSAADADDVYQRTLEVLLTKAPDGFDDEHLLAWTLTVARNEALMEHRRRDRFAGDFDDVVGELADVEAVTEDRLIDAEQLGQGREALNRIRPDQMRCMLMRADGMSYEEIGDRTGFSYAKVNRCLSEGRKAFRAQLGRLESGSECARLAGALSMFADGTAPVASHADVELHLKNCLACQATLRDYRHAPDRAAALLPLGLLTSAGAGRAGGAVGRMREAIESGYASLQERLFGHASAAHQSAEYATAKKVAAIAAMSATLVAGGAAIEHETHHVGDSGSRHATSTPSARELTAHPAEAKRSADSTTTKRAHTSSRARAARAADLADPRSASGGAASDAQEPAAGTSVPSNDFSPPPSAGSDESAAGGSSDQSTDLAP